MSDTRQGPKRTPADAAELRRRAEEKAGALGPDELGALSFEETGRLIHELRVHQIELEMQNEELRRAQEEVEAAKDRYFDLYDLAPVGYCTVSEKSLILEANLTAATLLGMARAALVRQPLTRFILKEDQDIYYRHRRQLFETGAPQICEVRLVWPDDVPFWARLQAAAVQGDGGEPLCRVIISNIAEQRQAEALLQQSRTNLRNTLDSLNDGVIQIDRDFVISVGNRALENLFGIPRDKLAGGHCYEVIHGRNAVCPGCRVKDFFEGKVQASDGRPLIHETMSLPDGRILDRKVYPTHSGENRSPGVTVVVCDITTQKKAEEALSESEKRLQLAVAGTGVGLWDWNMVDGVVYFSPQWKRMLGYEEQEIENAFAGWKRLWHPDDLDKIERAVNDYAAGKTSAYEIEHRLRHKNGSWRWILTRGDIVKDSDGKPVRWVGTNLDITERVALQQRLHQMEKAASLSRMAGAVAHHFNNLMTVVMCNLELARMDIPQGDALAKTLAEAFRGSQRAAELSRLMLTVLGMTPSKRKPADLSKTCRDHLTGLRATIPDRVTVESDFSVPGPVVMVDTAQMGEVLVALATNAWEAMGDSEGRIRVSVSAAKTEDIHDVHRFPVDWEPSTDLHACLIVADSGCGMDDQTISRIFDPFYTDKFTGRGLGLAVALGFVKSFGGCITVESEQGQGSAFQVFIPISSEAVPQPALDAPAHAEKPLKAGAILLADDDEMVRDAAKLMLTHFGFEVLTAEDGVAAVEIFRKRKVEICMVITDFTMPGMDGWDTMAALREIRPDIPVILVSGYGEAQAMAGDHAEQPQFFLSKPYRMSTLKTALNTVLGGN